VAGDLILALDQGTTSSRAIAFDRAARPVASAQQPFEQRFPSPGHVTHDPEAIWSSQLAVAREVVAAVGGPDRIASIGIANQRETTIVWDRTTGAAVADAIVWQSRITADRCEALRGRGLEPMFRARTGLPLDAYFSGPKIAHILDSGAGLRARAHAGDLAFGTVDTFLLWRLTAGRVHATDPSNASRTLLFDIHRLEWDDELLGHVDVPRAVLPQVRPTNAHFGTTDPSVFGRPIPIAALVGDQQAALFGQTALEAGTAKNTYGTGAFLLLNTGAEPVSSEHGLLSTIGWQLDGRSAGNPATTYALEGSVFVAGAAVQWLRDGLRAITAAPEVEELAASVADTGGVYLVPAFTGLGAPHWDPTARGALLGLTRGTGLAEIALATLESIAFQVSDVVDAMVADGAPRPTTLRVDGGAAANDLLLQLQADILDVPVERPAVLETTALGAAYLAGLGVGFWPDVEALRASWRLERRFEPAMPASRRERLLEGWRRAVDRSKGWVIPETPGERVVG
jgi:glycerol kinase